jgi:hypothetical protein
MTGRRLTTGATLVALVAVLCVMAVWGYRAATAPIAKDTPSAPSTGPTCQPEDQQVVEYVRRGEVTVSVYNAGKRSGGARITMDLLEEAGFRPGEVGNAPEGIEVDRAVVYTNRADDPGAELVAQALGKSTQVVHTDEEYGPGVDVVINDRFKRLDPAAPRRLALPVPEITCD